MAMPGDGRPPTDPNDSHPAATIAHNSQLSPTHSQTSSTYTAVQPSPEINTTAPSLQNRPSRIDIPEPIFQQDLVNSPSLMQSSPMNEKDQSSDGESKTRGGNGSLAVTTATAVKGDGAKPRHAQIRASSTMAQSPGQEEPLRNSIFARQTFAEGMTGGLNNLRRRAMDRMHSFREKDSTNPATSEPLDNHVTGSSTARPVMPRSRPSMAQFKMREQPSKMIIPPPYGQNEVQEAAMALAAGIPDGIPSAGLTNDPRLYQGSFSESESSDEEPQVRVHFEIHLQEYASSQPICPLSERNVDALSEELQLTPQERADVEAIQTKEDLRAYFENFPRDYDVQIIISDMVPDSPEVRFATDDVVVSGDRIQVVRRESVTSHSKRSGRRKKRYRRPTTDLSTLPVEEPKATWTELFYDLLFVANLTEFTHNHPITGGAALAHYICWFIIMWWAWAGQTFWASRYDMDDLFTKVMKLIEFCALVSFGAFSSDHLDSTSVGFTCSYIVLKGILAIEYGNVLYWAKKQKSKKSLTPLLLQMGSNILAMIIWGLSNLVSSMIWRYVMWFISILIEVVALVAFGRRSSVTFAGSHLPERFALFTIIVLGENVIGLVGLSAGAAYWEAGEDMFLLLFLLNTIILYGLWWLYFDDFSEDVFHKTTALSQLWAYLHLPFHLCIVLVGTGALDLIRLYKTEHGIRDMPPSPSGASHMITSTPTGFEVPVFRSAAGASGGALEGRMTDYRLTKQYFLVVCSFVFLCNSLLKWINLRSYDRFQKIVYLSRFLNSIFILCLLAVPDEKMTPFALLGSMAAFCAIQVAVDLAVIYFGAYGFVNDLEAWARSARSSVDIGSLLPSPLGGRSRANSKMGSAVTLPGVKAIGAVQRGFGTSSQDRQQRKQQLQQQYFQQQQQKQQLNMIHENNSSVSSLPHRGNNSVPPSLASPKPASVSGLPLQPPVSPTSSFMLPSPRVPTADLLGQQSQTALDQQQALYNMHLNANSLGVSGAYGNLVQALAEIKRREQWNRESMTDGQSPVAWKHVSLSNTAPPRVSKPEPGTSSRCHSRRTSVNLIPNAVSGQRLSISEQGQGQGAGSARSGGYGKGGAQELTNMFKPPPPPSSHSRTLSHTPTASTTK